jgi:hypothetical protein
MLARGCLNRPANALAWHWNGIEKAFTTHTDQRAWNVQLPFGQAARGSARREWAAVNVPVPIARKDPSVQTGLVDPAAVDEQVSRRMLQAELPGFMQNSGMRYELRWPGRVAALVLLSLILSIASSSAFAQSGAEPRFLVDFGAAHFNGDYGTPQSTSIQMVSARLRWFVPRGEIQVTAPFFRLAGPGDVSFVGGNPVPGFRDRRPPGAGPPGGRPSGPPVDFPGPASGDTDGQQGSVLERSSISGMGDLVVQGEAYVLEGSRTRPWVTSLLAIKIPTADEYKGLGTGKVDVEAGLGLVQPAGPLRVLADASYIRIGRPDWIELRDVVRLGGGVSLPLGTRSNSQVYAYLENRTNPVLNLADQRSLALGTGLKLGRDGRVRVSGALSIGLSDTVEELGFSLRLGRAF